MSVSIITALIGIAGDLYKSIRASIDAAKQNAELTEEQAAALNAKLDEQFKSPEWQVEPDPVDNQTPNSDA